MKRVKAILAHPLYQRHMQDIAKQESSRRFCRHDIEHCLSVARIMLLCAEREQRQLDPALLYAAALLHDIGRAACCAPGRQHAQAACTLAGEILPACGYRAEQTAQVLHAIRLHNDATPSEEPLTLLLRFADHRSRNCFLCTARDDCHWPETEKNQEVFL